MSQEIFTTLGYKFTNTYKYTPGGLIKYKETDVGEGSFPVARRTWEYEYDDEGRVISQDAGGRGYTYQYNAMGQLWKLTENQIVRAQATYGVAGQITGLTYRTLTQNFYVTESRTYNARLQLTRVTADSGLMDMEYHDVLIRVH